ncbi:hypothetical protein GOBAR_DD19764 [Gossypium barbadense]|nr:hypothetical protein GOBAR_DD19764 [Gossypium barbadense]
MDKLLPLSFTFLVFIFMVFKLWMRSKIKETPKNLPPAPWKLPIIGHLHLLIFALPHQRLAELAKRHGSLMHLELGELSYVVVSSPEAAKEALSPWCRNRIIQSFRYCFCTIWKLLEATSKSLHIGATQYETSTIIPFSQRRAGRCKKHEAFISFLKKFVEAMAGFNIADLFPSIKFLPYLSGMRAELERFHHDIDTMLESIIQEHRDSSANPEDSVDVTEDLVDVLLNLQDHGGLEFPLTINNIKAVILDILMGGTETSSTLAEWAMLEMMKNPRILGKAQAEETLRLHPPLPLLIPRENSERCEINGYEIPAKTRVIVNAWAIGRDSNYWNEAERFYPERFIDGSVDYKGTNFEFIPFGAGRRICPGMSYGMAVVELSLAKLLSHFDWKLPNGMKNEDLDMTEAFGVSVKRKNELHVIPIPYCQ